MIDYRPAYPRGGGREKELFRRREGKTASTSGGAAKGSKGPNCQTDATKKFWLTSPKAHRRKGYRAEVIGHMRKAGMCAKVPTACREA